MQMRLTRPVLASGARLTSGTPLIVGTRLVVVRAAAGALLLGVVVSACSSGGSASPTPSVYTPSVRSTGPSAPVVTRTPSVGSGSSAPASAGPSTAKATPTPTRAISSAPASSSPKPKPKPTKKPRPRHTVTKTRFPTAAPQTGGGGTAGLQDGLLLGVGGAALLGGLGSLAYRRRLRRSLRSAQHPAGHNSGPARPSDREPADR